MLGSLGPLPAAREGDTVSLAVFALVVVIWVALLVPLSRRGRAELAAEASEGGSRLSSGGARPWTNGNIPAEPTEDELEAAAVAARLARRRAAAPRGRPPPPPPPAPPSPGAPAGG